ncbi:pyridoxamine 5'-phosphate oxidase family protein [Candidatus Woesearchaeota archaeon]|nr:pyridoxamine 5'-phosphate oxidase family protein [Candidatus Woesearchaeota archaeon]
MKEEVKKIIEENPVSLATVNLDGKPNVNVVAFVKVKDEKLIITDNHMSQTKENILANPNVCLAVWDKDWNGYKLIGEAKYFDSGEWLDFVKALEENKEEPAKGAVVISVKEVRKLA